MFYGGGREDGGRGGNNNRSSIRNERFEQMTKQQELIEFKKQEIQRRLEEEKHKKTMEALLMETKPPLPPTALGSSSSTSTRSAMSGVSSREKSSGQSIKSEEDSKPAAPALPFVNDGSFLENFKRMQEEKKKEKEKEKEAASGKSAIKQEVNEYGSISPKPTLKIFDPNTSNSGTGGNVRPGGNSNNDSGGNGNNSGAYPPPPPPRFGGPRHNNAVPPPSSLTAPPPPPPPRPSHSSAPPNRPYMQEQQQRQPYMGFGYQNAPPPPPPPPPPAPRSGSYQQQTQSPHSVHQYPPRSPNPPTNTSNPSNSDFYGSQAKLSGFPSEPVKKLAADVAEGGDAVEEMARVTKKDDPIFWFLHRPDSQEYGRYRDLVTHLKFENMPPSPPREIKPLMFQPPLTNFNQGSPNQFVRAGVSPNMMATPPPPPPPIPQQKRSLPEDTDAEDEASKRRRSRWGPQSGAAVAPPAMIPPLFPPQEEKKFSPMGGPGIGIGIKLETPPPPPPVVAYPIGGLKQEAGQPLFGGDMKIPPPGVMQQMSNFSPMVPNVNMNLKGPPPMLTRVTRTNPQLLSYARQSYGTVDLDEEQWKQCEEAYKMNLLFQDIARKKAKDEQIAMAGKFKHEYDSDEEVDDGGTWEHKQRMKEMEKTKDWAHELTNKAKGKHHIGDFLPPEELEKFMDKYKAVKEGRQMDESAYQDFKIAQDNVGFKLLQKMGWNDGQGLGSSGQGITAPIDKGAMVSDKQGLGVEKPSELSQEDDEYAAYRKRMMLAYRFRPNPLNNPRRAYY